MRKRLLLLLAAVLLLTGACSEKPDAAMYETVSQLHAGYAELSRAHLGFMMEASFRDEDSGEAGVLYYISGDAKYDIAADTAWQSFTATLLAATYKAEEYYADDRVMHIEGEEVFELQTPSAEFFGAYPYQPVPLPAFSSVKTLTEESSGDATMYTVVAAEGQKQLVEEVWKLDLYQLAGIVVPNRDKESYGDVTYTFSVKDGKVQALYVKLTVSIYETPGYTPGYTPKDEDYRLDLTVSAQITLRETGDAVEIPVYNEAKE